MFDGCRASDPLPYFHVINTDFVVSLLLLGCVQTLSISGWAVGLIEAVPGGAWALVLRYTVIALNPAAFLGSCPSLL